jgi:hypothetical protein
MAKWASSLILDGGSDLLRARGATPSRIKEHVLKAYAAGDSYATVTGNSCAVTDMADTDFVQSGAAGAARVTTVAAKAGVSVTADSGAGPDLHIALVDSTTNEVLLVTNETSDQVLTSGNTVNVPAWTYTVGQPA